MYIDKHYPFEMIPLNYSLTGFDDFLDFATLSIHYNQLYKDAINKLNSLLKDIPVLQTLTLDEILFNESYVPNSKRSDIEKAAGSVYNHQIYFNSITPNPITSISNPLKQAIEKKYKTMKEFYKEFKQTALDLYGSGYVFLVCNNKGDVFIYPTQNYATTVPFDFCPIIALDMWEHAYYLKYMNKKADYIDNFLKYINWDYANKEYEECLKAITTLNNNEKMM